MTWGVPPGGARCPCAELREAPCSSQHQAPKLGDPVVHPGAVPLFPFPCSWTLGPGVSLPRLTCPLGSLAPFGPGKERR